MDFSHDFATQSFQHDMTFPGQQQYNDFEHVDVSAGMQEPPYIITGPVQKMPCDVKPRLTKDQHDVLETHYQAQSKPNTSTKRRFAEQLNVSLEKVNNWFQNRRAKSKQDAKKQQSTVNVFSTQQPSQVSINISSDSDTSPAFASPEYARMMQEDDASSFAFEQPAQPMHSNVADVPLMHPQHDTQNSSLLQTMQHDMTASQEFNRRTLTQEQFDAFSKHQDLMLSSGDIANLSQDPEALNKLLTGLGADAQHETFSFSTMQDDGTQHMQTFPLSALMQDHTLSVPSSDWTGSRSSSASLPQSVGSQEMVTQGQWQPGQSVPVDVNQLNQEFQKVAEARQHSLPDDESIGWPSEEILQRRDSSTSLLAHSMGNVGLHTPQPGQQAVFKSPTPASSLAARRQRQRPAPLGLASLRSQSYTGMPQTASPGHMQSGSLSATPQLRRIKSSNVVGGIAQGRVQKNVAAPQRSPLAWSFADAMVSPKAMRHNSTSTLAPPTPASPEELADQAAKAQQQWQMSSGSISQPGSISETDAEHNIYFGHQPGQSFSSPPHTPMYNVQQQPQFLPPQPITGNIIMENTPPQSAPASQQCFPSGIFMASPQQMHQHHHSQSFVHPNMHQPVQQAYLPQQQLMMDQSQMMMQPQLTLTEAQAMEMPMQFGHNGLPIVDAQGQMGVAMPSQLHFVQQKSPRTVQQQAKAPSVQPTAASMQSTFATTLPTPHAQEQKNPTQQNSADFFVHEYTPPQDLKRTATPRKAVDTGPKNYTFANQTPEHFEKGKKGDKTSSESSPLSSTSS